MNKQTTIQLRVDNKLKSDFYMKAEDRGETPSEYLRFLMDLAVKEKIRMTDQFNCINQVSMALVQHLFNVSYKMKDESLFEDLVKDTNLLFLYRELVLDFATSSEATSEEEINQIVDHQMFSKLGFENWRDNPKFKHSYPDYSDFKKIRDKKKT